MRSGGLKYASPLKKGKSHAIWVLSETLSPPIEKFFAEDLQLLRPPALLRTTNKPQNSRRLERAITRIYKFGKISRIFIGLVLFHIGKAGNFLWSPNTNTNTFLWSLNTSDQQTSIRTSRQGPITERGWVENWKDRNRLVGKMTLCLCKRLFETPTRQCCQSFLLHEEVFCICGAIISDDDDDEDVLDANFYCLQASRPLAGL